MKKDTRLFSIAICLLMAFALWTAAICQIDVQAIGPQGSAVGFASLNGYMHSMTGVHMALYTLTDWLGLVPVAFVLGFGLLGLVQWIKRKKLSEVDTDLLLLGGFYIIVLTAYLIFEFFVVNFRPVLINENLEASYPSSTTMLTLCVMSTATAQLNKRIRHTVFRRCAVSLITVFTVFMVLGRLISGVHWFSDIVGGILLSAGLVTLYLSVCRSKQAQ